MFNFSSVEACLSPLIGWKDYFDTDIPRLDAARLISDSGQFYNLNDNEINLDTIYNTMPQGKNLSTYLEERTKGSITNLMTAVFNKKFNAESTKSLFKQQYIFPQPGNKNNLITPSGRFVGFQLILKNEIGIQTLINRIGLQFNAVQTALKIYLFHSSQQEPISSLEFTTAAANNMQFFDAALGGEVVADEWKLDYYVPGVDAGGEWFLGYFENDITGQAVKKDFDFRTGPCRSCSPSAMKLYNTLTDKVGIFPITVDSGSLNGNDLFNIDNIVYSSNSNFGLNLGFTCVCDNTQVICDQKHIIVDALKLQVKKDIYTDILNSTRLNYLEGVAQSIILSTVKGDEATQIEGIDVILDRKIDSLNFDMSRLSMDCLPCAKNKGYRPRAI